jgi:hypothetical protein
MDGSRLDAFARQLALSRRGFLRTLVGGAAAGTLALVGRGSALAKPHPKDCPAFCDAAGLTKKTKGQCHQDCAQGGTTGLYADCNGDLGNLCPTAAGPVCHDLANDPTHCGSCTANPCAAPMTACIGGTCACPAATPDFCDLGFGDQRCVDTQSDPNFCGGCHNVCVVPGATCVGGQCVPPTCPGPFFDLQTDPENCGACGNVCGPSNPTCYQGTCACVAAAPIDPASGQVAPDSICGPEYVTHLTCDAAKGEGCFTCGGRWTPGPVPNCQGGNVSCCPEGEDCTWEVAADGLCVAPIAVGG